MSKNYTFAYNKGVREQRIAALSPQLKSVITPQKN